MRGLIQNQEEWEGHCQHIGCVGEKPPERYPCFMEVYKREVNGFAQWCHLFFYREDVADMHRQLNPPPMVRCMASCGHQIEYPDKQDRFSAERLKKAQSRSCPACREKATPPPLPPAVGSVKMPVVKKQDRTLGR